MLVGNKMNAKNSPKIYRLISKEKYLSQSLILFSAQVCLDRSLDYSSHCPLCNASFGDVYSLRNSLSCSNTTKFIELAMQRFVPAAYQKRRLQEIEKEPYVPVFICTTAFPYVPCPLFVYESRYRLMIRRAIESGVRQFGIVQPIHVPPPVPVLDSSNNLNGGAAALGIVATTMTSATTKRYSDFGTVLNIRDCVLLADGRSILSTVGGRRFRVVKRKERDGYDTAKVQYIYDDPVAKERLASVAGLHDKVLAKARQWYMGLPEKSKEEILKSFGSMPDLEPQWENIPDGPAWSWYIIALMPLHQTLKVRLFYILKLIFFFAMRSISSIFDKIMLYALQN